MYLVYAILNICIYFQSSAYSLCGCKYNWLSTDYPIDHPVELPYIMVETTVHYGGDNCTLWGDDPSKDL